MHICFFGPLGWKSDVWGLLEKQLDEEDHTYTYFAFPDKRENPQEYEKQVIDKLKSEKIDVVIACSYGVNFFLHCAHTYKQLFHNAQVILIDGLLDVDCQDVIKGIKDSRQEYFRSFEEYVQMYLGDAYSTFELEIIKSVYNAKKNTLLFSNEQLAKWIEHISVSTKKSVISETMQHLDEIVVFATNMQWKEMPNVRYFEQINSEQHLLMVTNPERITKILAYKEEV